MNFFDHYQSLKQFLHDLEQDQWANELEQQVNDGLCEKRYGDLPAWKKAFQQLPDIHPSTIELSQSVSIGQKSDANKEVRATLEQSLRALIPWRKGPYTLFDIHIDTEWRSDWKWDRLRSHISSLKNRTVLDVGCGNGYHCLRMLGDGAAQVIGIDPSPRFIIQFLMLKKYLGQIPADILPIGIEHLPSNLAMFDTTFSMGVLYHRRSPIDHIRELKATLKPGGQLVLETLIIDGKLGECLVPEGRYAMMRNVWFIPSAPTLLSWLKKCGFKNPRLVDHNITTLEEQRSTEWMTFQSLQDFLNPDDNSQTVEGHPAPMRGVFVAEA
ncbi:MAG: tRNA 5-methoxyuridine(34)/uridine 5-oxyacetic acid(34) synthase CmoB [Cellvibrionaceae bacterium]